MSDFIFSKIASFGNDLLFFNVLFFLKNDQIHLPFLIFFLLSSSFFFSVIIGFRNILLLPKIFYKFLFNSKEKNTHNETNVVSTKKIILSATGGAVDLGSLFGVASVVVVGGPGVIFWLIFGGLISTAIRFSEVYCGHKFRKKKYSNGKFNGYVGGPSIYIQKVFNLYKIPKIGYFVAKVYALNLTLSTFCSLQVNQTIHVITHTIPVLKDYDWMLSLTVACTILLIVIKGLSYVIKFNSKCVPIMVIAYIIFTILILIMNYKNIIPSIEIIVKDAFNFKAINGGIFSIMILGVQRAFFCNESGSGSGAIIHANSSNDNSYKEALMSIVTPIISVLIVSMCSGMIIMTTNVYKMMNPEMSGIDFIIQAFSAFHPSMKYFTLILVPLFGLTTAITWAYYGSSCWADLFGRKRVYIYYILLFIAYFLCGIVRNFDTILNVADILGLSITIPNTLSLIMLSKFIIRGIKKKC